MPLILENQPPYYQISEVLPPPTPGSAAPQTILALTQSSTTAPTIIEQKNDLGTYTPTRQGLGTYWITFDDPVLTANKTSIQINNTNPNNQGTITAEINSTTVIEIRTYKLYTDLEGLPLTFTPTDAILDNDTITITVQP